MRWMNMSRLMLQKFFFMVNWIKIGLQWSSDILYYGFHWNQIFDSQNACRSNKKEKDERVDVACVLDYFNDKIPAFQWINEIEQDKPLSVLTSGA